MLCGSKSDKDFLWEFDEIFLRALSLVDHMVSEEHRTVFEWIQIRWGLIFGNLLKSTFRWTLGEWNILGVGLMLRDDCRGQKLWLDSRINISWPHWNARTPTLVDYLKSVTHEVQRLTNLWRLWRTNSNLETSLQDFTQDYMTCMV